MNHRVLQGAVLSLLVLGAYSVAVTAPAPSGARRDSGKRGGADPKIGVPDVNEEPLGKRTGRWAVVIGAGQYDDRSWPAMPCAAKDASDVAQVLTDSGFDVALLRDTAEDGLDRPRRNNILREVSRLAPGQKPVDAESTVVVYFSGHGLAQGGEAYLVASDTSQNDAVNTGVKVSQLAEYLETCRARHKILILDACYSGAQGSEFLAQMVRIKGLIVMSSCQGDEVSRLLKGVAGEPEEQNSAYTYFLVRGLRGEADRPEVDATGIKPRDGQITHEELHTYVQTKVVEWAKMVGYHKRSPDGAVQATQNPSLSAVGVGAGVILAGKPAPGELAINAEPWAEIYLDGKFEGHTPKVVTGVAAGRHTLVLRNPARANAIEEPVELAPGESKSISRQFRR